MVRVLERVSDDLGDLCHLKLRGGHTVHHDRAAGRFQEAVQCLRQGGLPGPVPPNDGNIVAGPDVEVEPLESLNTPFVRELEIACGDDLLLPRNPMGAGNHRLPSFLGFRTSSRMARSASSTVRKENFDVPIRVLSNDATSGTWGGATPISLSLAGSLSTCLGGPDSSSFPSFINTNRSESARASSASLSARMTVMPCFSFRSLRTE